MKRIAYLFVAFAFFGVVALSSCKAKTEPAVEETTPVEEVAPVADTVAVDSAAAIQ
jgi:hypothetical protein